MTARTIHIVQRRGFDTEFPSNGDPVAAFLDRQDADRYVAQFWTRHCGDLNPFLIPEHWHDVLTTTNMHIPVLRKYVTAAGVAPPPLPSKHMKEITNNAWVKWWEEHVIQCSDEKREYVWKAFDNVRVLDVIECELIGM